MPTDFPPMMIFEGDGMGARSVSLVGGAGLCHQPLSSPATPCSEWEASLRHGIFITLCITWLIPQGQVLPVTFPLSQSFSLEENSVGGKWMAQFPLKH